MAYVFPRRGESETWYPAGATDVTARWITLAHGERVRIVEPRDDAGSAALLVHGWGCNVFHFRKLVPALRNRGVHAIAVDLRGHGLSHKPADPSAYSAPAMVAFVRQVMDALGLESAGVIGHSLGGAIALDTALAMPARVEWLLLLNPVGLTRLRGAPLFTRLPLRFAERIPHAMSRVVAAATVRMAYSGTARPERGDVEQYLFPTLTPGGRFGVLAYTRAYFWEPRTTDDLRRLACPTRVMLGERDRVIKRRAAERHLRASNITVEVVPEAGHVLAEEAPERVADAALELARRATPNGAPRAPAATR